jgi:hypothetical protein
MVLLLVGMTAPTARAGIYNLEEPPTTLPPAYSLIGRPIPDTDLRFERLPLLMSITDPDPKAPNVKVTPLREAYVAEEERLKEKQKGPGLSVAETISYTACLLRRGRYDLASRALDVALAHCPDNEPGRAFLLLHQAVAYEHTPGLEQRVQRLRELALKAWPSAWPGWGQIELEWYYRAEKYQLELLKLRQRQPSPMAPLEPLFPKARFVGRSGKYEAGGIAPAQAAELPVEAEAIVVQLLLWQPADQRLLWLYGELLNARGDVATAADVLIRCADNGLSNVPELMQHRAILKAAVKNLPPKRDNFVAAQPSPAATRPTTVTPPPPPPADPAASSGDYLPDLRVLGTGVVIGLFLGVITVVQWQHWQRRRDRASPH